jgi:hypothetical protein
MSADLRKLEVKIKAVAEGVGAVVLDVLPQGGSGLAPLDEEQMMAVITRVKPSIVYIASRDFDVDDEMEEAIDRAAASGVGLPQGLEALSRRAARYNGQTCEFTAVVPVDGLFHLLMESADWYAVFEDEFAAQQEKIEALSHTNTVAAQAAEDVDLREKAKTLSDHPAFSNGRPSAEKRRALAAALFQDLRGQALYEVTTRADELHWLRANGVTPPD